MRDYTVEAVAQQGKSQFKDGLPDGAVPVVTLDEEKFAKRAKRLSDT